ncbi:hypothetical protein AVEN_50240-1 [Araneus ventricosus]|uniref:Uncharacterized protein n=1 Tax=Araneus ventricosus TaxID=182803 RepID=A0A4Y2E8E6_ARAVE|nr:hypothetical protein AVEN_50240-1 [Araneus ventricosus]
MWTGAGGAHQPGHRLTRRVWSTRMDGCGAPAGPPTHPCWAGSQGWTGAVVLPTATYVHRLIPLTVLGVHRDGRVRCGARPVHRLSPMGLESQGWTGAEQVYSHYT